MKKQTSCHVYGQMNLKVPRPLHEERTISSTNGAGKIGNPHAKE